LRHFVNFKYEIWCIILELEYQNNIIFKSDAVY